MSVRIRSTGGGGGAGTDDQTAAEVPFTPAGTLAATDVQAAIEELDDATAVRDVLASAQGVWTGDAPAGRAARDPRTLITFAGPDDPTDGTDGIATPGNIVTGDRWDRTADYV